MPVRTGDVFRYTANGVTWRLVIVNISDYREPALRYAADIYLGDETTPAAKDLVFFGDNILSKCVKEK